MTDVPEKKTRVSNKALEDRIILVENKLDSLNVLDSNDNEAYKEQIKEMFLELSTRINKLEKQIVDTKGDNGISVSEHLNMESVVDDPFIYGGEPVNKNGVPLPNGSKRKQDYETRNIP